MAGARDTQGAVRVTLTPDRAGPPYRFTVPLIFSGACAKHTSQHVLLTERQQGFALSRRLLRQRSASTNGADTTLIANATMGFVSIGTSIAPAR